MRSHFSHEIQFVKHRKVLFAISAALVVLALVGLLVRGLNFGIEFLGGTQVTFNGTGDVTRSMVIAFVVVIALITAYVSIRYEFKMALMGVLSLIQVLVIVAGIYAWTAFEVTPNVVAALLTIMGYCLYDTVVVFNRVNENIRNLKDGVHRTALQITNWSENQVIVRSINTALTSIVPVLAMLIFGGDTLKGFAFAMVVGLVLGAYSSIAIAAPAYALWKGREPEWREAERRYGEGAAQGKASS